MSRKHIIVATIVGIVVPVVGIFVGLQVSTIIGSILAFPIIAVSMLTGVPFGMWSIIMWLVAFAFSIIVWNALFYIVSKLRKRLVPKSAPDRL